jgi:hypothetical protein
LYGKIVNLITFTLIIILFIFIFYFWGLHPVVSVATDFLGFRQSQLILFNVLYFIPITYPLHFILFF